MVTMLSGKQFVYQHNLIGENMPQVTERWINPEPNRPNKDVVHLDDGTYCWADHNTNNFDIDKWTLHELQQRPYIDKELLDVVALSGPPDIIGSGLIGSSSLPSLSFNNDYDVDHDTLGDEDDVEEREFNPIEFRPRTSSEPKNNDGRTHCYKCNQPTKLTGGGMYQVCGNPNCEWFDN